MTLYDLVTRVRSYTRDTTGTLFELSDIENFINEGIDKLRQIKALETMATLTHDDQSVDLLPPQYHYCLAVYSASRCFSQDEQHYLAQTFAEEFNGLYDLIELGIKEGTIVIADDGGNVINDNVSMDAVPNVYFKEI